MSGNNDASAQANPFIDFWTDWARRMAGAAVGEPTKETIESMQRSFLDIMSKQADQFMRSEAFLSSMKQAMDNSLAWQKAFNELMQRGLGAAQVPTRADADHLVTLVRGLEERIVNKIEDLSERVERLENKTPKNA